MKVDNRQLKVEREEQQMLFFCLALDLKENLPPPPPCFL
jgi:hypothetical protein